MTNKLKVGIVGSGIQGVCNALFLQKKGFQVTLFDREEPGSQAASYGNAGHFSPYASVPVNRPDILSDVPAMLLSSTGPLALKWNYVPKMLPWFIKFIKNCSKKNMMHTAKYMHQILDLALPAYDELFEEIDLTGLVENKGIMYIWNDQNLKSRELEINIRNEIGAEQQLLTKSEIHDLEPNIKNIYINLQSIYKFVDIVKISHDKNCYRRIIDAINDTHTFYLMNKTTILCSYVEDWNTRDQLVYNIRLIISKLLQTCIVLYRGIIINIPERYRNIITDLKLYNLLLGIVCKLYKYFVKRFLID